MENSRKIIHKKMLNNGRKAASIGKDIYKNLWKNTTGYHDYGRESMLFGGDTGIFEYKTQANQWLEELGYDGIRHIDYYNPGKRGQSHEVTIAFNPNQVKSVHAQFRNDNSKLSENRNNSRIIIPNNLSNISRNDLKEIYFILRNGHAMDDIEDINPRRDKYEIFDIINNALEKLSRVFNQNNEIIIYRTIGVDNPQEWIIENMKWSQHLGVYWTYTEELTQSHENSVLFCAVATTKNVNWVETIILAIDGMEDEIRLIPNSSITLRYVEPCPYDFNPEQKQFV